MLLDHGDHVALLKLLEKLQVAALASARAGEGKPLTVDQLRRELGLEQEEWTLDRLARSLSTDLSTTDLSTIDTALGAST